MTTMHSIARDDGSVTGAREWWAEAQRDRDAQCHPGHAGDEIIGASAALTAVLRQVALVAPTDATVLIQGRPAPAKSSSPAPSIRAMHAATTPSSTSTAPPFPQGCW